MAAARTELDRLRGAAQPVVDPSMTSANARLAVEAMVRDHPEDVREGIPVEREDELKVAFLTGIPWLSRFIVAISAGSVFFGAMTYIGNGPNFMVKSIAEAGGVKTPGFVAYVVWYALPILLPVLIVVWAVFLRG